MKRCHDCGIQCAASQAAWFVDTKALQRQCPTPVASSHSVPAPNCTVVLHYLGRAWVLLYLLLFSTCAAETRGVLLSWDAKHHVDTKACFLLPVGHWGWSNLGVWSSSIQRLLTSLEGPALGLDSEQSSPSLRRVWLCGWVHVWGNVYKCTETPSVLQDSISMHS